MKHLQEFLPAIDRIAVLGGGAWGTALAATAARAGRRVTLWARESKVVEDICRTGINTTFLPGIRLPAGIEATADIAIVVRDADALLLVVPSQYIRAACRSLRPILAPHVPVVICSKGIERDSGLLLRSVIGEELPHNPVAVLSGPTFAHEVAAGEPTAVTIASDDVPTAGEASLAARMALALGTRTFRPYVADDVTGVEVGGAVKNVLALASGMATGLSFGSNTRAAIITRGLDEIKRLSEALGGRRDTVTGLSGIGDLTLTCSSEQSRNMRYGMGLAAGRSSADIFDGRPVVVEGVENAVSITDLARRLGVEMPICEAVRAVVIDGKPIREVMAELLDRPFRGEPASVDLVLPGPSAPASSETLAGAAGGQR
jgi:glycerol-3-phosphate dehydrogenase (NAD(P)+)